MLKKSDSIAPDEFPPRLTTLSLFSVASAVIGLFVFPIFFAPLAVVTGIMGFSKVPDRRNRRYCIIGTAVGIIELLVVLFIAVS